MTAVTTARVESVTPLSNTILHLTLLPERFIPYEAGQYLKVMYQGKGYEYSIANAPLGAQKYELHIRHTPDNPYNEPLLAHIQETGAVELKLPFGECHMGKLHDNLPIICIAGGTGFAPIKAMIEQWLAKSDSRTCELYWGAKSQSELYLDNQVMHWGKHVPSFRYALCLPNQHDAPIMPTLLQHHQNDLDAFQYVLAGPFDMVYAIRDQLVELGVKGDRLFSDAFAFE